MNIEVYWRSLVLGCVALSAASGCSPDPNEAANKLFVEAQQLIESAEKQPRAPEKLAKLRQGEGLLKDILTKYPAATLAVQLASGQSVGKVSLDAVAKSVAAQQRLACYDQPTRACLFDEALLAAESIEDGALLFEYVTGNRRSLFDTISFLSRTAAEQEDSGLLDAANTTFKRAHNLLEEASKKRSATISAANLMQALARAGKQDEAFKVYPVIAADEQNQGFAQGVLLGVAKSLAKRGLTDPARSAMKMAASIITENKSDKKDAYFLGLQAQSLAHLGDSSEAKSKLAEALKINDPGFGARMQVALAQIELGDIAGAEATVSEMLAVMTTEASKELDIYSALISGGSAICAVLDISKYVDKIKNSTMRDSVLQCATRGLADAGKLEDAQRAASSIKLSYFRIGADCAIARALEKEKRTEDARKKLFSAIDLLPRLETPAMRPHALVEIARSAPQSVGK